MDREFKYYYVTKYVVSTGKIDKLWLYRSEDFVFDGKYSGFALGRDAFENYTEALTNAQQKLARAVVSTEKKISKLNTYQQTLTSLVVE